MSKQGTSIYVYYDDFEYKGEVKTFSYEVPFEVVCDGIRHYFDIYDVNIDGTDNHIWNVIAELDAFSTIEDAPEFVTYCHDVCVDSAYEEFLEEEKDDESIWNDEDDSDE